MPRHGAASMLGIGGRTIEMVEVVAEGFAGWFISALAEFTIGFIRNKVPLGKKRNVVRNRVHDLLRTDSKKVQDALKKMLSKHIELKTALSLINESLALLEKPLHTGFLKITRLMKQTQKTASHDETSENELPSAARSKLEQALEICRRVQLETLDIQAKIEAVKIRLFLTYVLFAHDAQYTPSVVIKLLVNCLNESLDPTDPDTGLGGTLVILDRRKVLKQVLRVSEEEKIIVKQVRELLLNTLSQISWYSRIMGHAYTDEDLEEIKNCFFEPSGFQTEEIVRSWRPFILDWKSVLPVNNESDCTFSFDQTLKDVSYNNFFDQKIAEKSLFDFRILSAAAYPDNFYDHSFSIFVLAAAKVSSDIPKTVYTVLGLERIHAYPNAMGLKFSHTGVAEASPTCGFFDAIDDKYSILFRSKIVTLDVTTECFEVGSRLDPPFNMDIVSIRNCGRRLYALTEDGNARYIFEKSPADDDQWKNLGKVDKPCPNELSFMIREDETYIIAAGPSKIHIYTLAEASSTSWSSDEFLLTTYSKYHQGVFYIKGGALIYRSTADLNQEQRDAGDGLQDTPMSEEVSLIQVETEMTQMVPVGTEILLISLQALTFVDVFKIFAQ